MFQKKRILALILGISMSVSVFTPYAMAEEKNEYATREYVISEFVQSVGRNNLEESEVVLEMFTDSDKISDEYREDLSRAVVGGILKGYEDRTIRPDEPISRVEAMVMLARCVPELEAVTEDIEFSDVPNWAKEDITYLTKAGLVMGYGDGRMGAGDYITVEQVGLLTDRSDEALRTVSPGDSFYGYVNEKQFRNVDIDNATEIDPIHGAIVTKRGSWSHFNDIYSKIVKDEEEILNKIVNGEVEIQEGSAEQRVRDLLECIDSDIEMSESDIKNISDMRSAIINTGTVEEFLKITSDIYKQAGINVAFKIDISTDKETGVPYPTFSVASAGHAGFLAYRTKTNTKEYMNLYKDLISDYLETIGAEFTEEDVSDAVNLQIEASKDEDYFHDVITYLVFAQMFDLVDDATIEAEVNEIRKQHPEFFDEEGSNIGTYNMFESKDRDAADASFEGFDLCEELERYGFTNLEKIIIPVEKVTKVEKNLITEENLTALKINALIELSGHLGISLNKDEENAWTKVSMLPLMICLTNSAEELKEGLEDEAEEDASAEETFAETTGVEFDEGILSAVNLTKVNELLPNDIGLIYAKYYYDDEISNVIVTMLKEIGDAYAKRFGENTWMQDETKENALKKLENMLAIVAYPDNYTFPEITPMSEGGTLFSNTLSIERHELSTLIRCNEEKEFIRTQMYLPPDEVNACYIQDYNSINIPTGILNPPFYDTEASYAANLGAIGTVLAHEIGHAFDAIGAKYDENGCLRDWWTEDDAAEFEKIQEYFVEYYNQFEVVDGVIQDANITITENMADFAALQILMDIVGDDKEAQKECFEAYAKIWAELGTVAYLTDSTFMNDVHSSNVVRINAVVASFDQFYDIYGVEEGDAMYVAPENRLKLW